jgi:hypothetical protein
MKQPDYFHKGQQPRRSKGDLNSSVATRLDTPNADSTETTRIHSNPTMTFQTYTQNESNRYPNILTQSWGVGQ